MKKNLTKYDFFAINRRLNNNCNSEGYVKAIKQGELLKLNRKEQKRK